MNIIKRIASNTLVLILFCFSSFSSAVSLHLPKHSWWASDVDPTWASALHTQIDGTHSYLDVLALVNKYLRFTLWFVCFLFMIINWYKLIMAHGDSDKMKKATHALIAFWVSIAVCLLAYVIVKFAITLF